LRDESSAAPKQPGEPADAGAHATGTVTEPAREQELTILFTDVEGSTALRAARGDDLADEILRAHEDIVRRNLVRCGGHEAKFLGDGFLVDFPTPEAAVRCAVAIQRSLERHNAEDPERRVHIRIGIHHGDVSERDGNLYGQAVHGAARVMAEAAGRQILVSPVVEEQIRDRVDFDFVDCGLFWLKGFPERWRLYEVAWGDGVAGVRPQAEAPALTPFVERDDERANLRRGVNAALGGQGRLVFVSGEAGVGKSRLVQEVSAEAEARGMRVLVGHCVEMGGSPPYLPFVEIVEQAITGPRSTLAMRDALGDSAPEIARIVPGLRRIFPDISAPVDLPPELARRYLWNSVYEFTERAARQQPLLLVLEDLHWADESTILLTEYLAPLLAEMPVLMVGTYRDVEVGVSHPLARAVNQLMRRRVIDRIGLKRLSRDGVSAMVEGLAGQRPPPQLVGAIDAETEGNPFFVEEVFFHLAESGVLLDESGHVRADLHIDEVDVPESVRLVVGGRLERLSESTRDALVGAAVLGRTFPPDLVGQVAALEGDALIESLDEAERARLIAPAKGNGRLLFSHELIRQTLLADTSSLKRERLHARAAEAIERRHADDLEAHAADLAHHLSRAGYATDRKRLVRYLTISGDRAVEAAAFQDAVDDFQQAVSYLEEDTGDAGAELLERLAMALRSVGRWDEALATMNEALDLYESAGRTDAFGHLAWSMVYQLTWAGRFVEGVGVAQRALGTLGDILNADRARLLSASGWASSLLGDYATATGMFAQARAVLEQVGDERALADVLHMETIHHMGFAEFEEGVAAGLRAAEVFEREGALWDLSSVLAFVVYEDGALGRREQAAVLQERTMAMAERLGHLGSMFMLLADRVRGDGVMRGDLAKIEVLGRRMIEVCERGGLPWLYVGHMYVGLAAHWRGSWDVAAAELRRAVELEPPSAVAGQPASLLALHLAHAGHAHEVSNLYEEWRTQLPASGAVNSVGAWNMLFGFVEALYLIGRHEDAAALYPLLTEALELTEWVAFDGRLIQTRAGIAAAAGRRWDEAEEHFRIARAVADAMPNCMEQADLRRLQAKMYLERAESGDGERTRTLLEEALEEYERMGMPKHIETVRGMLRHTN
jgi:class 3 adenylate cyclase/tetratricopeptide (TPR) repeat protein